jgi:hypothetical protein
MTFPIASEFDPRKVRACHSVLVEVVHILGDYVEDMAIVGGWVPTLLIEGAAEEHAASMDVDLALNQEKISEEAYATINKILTEHGYRQNTEKNAQFKYFKDLTVDGQTFTIELDLLTGEYGGDTGRSRRHESIQDVHPLKARGADLVFERTKTITVSGELPNDGGKDTVTCKIAGVVPFLVMKGIVLARRKKPKDAYDIEYVLRFYPGSIETIAELMSADLENGLVKEALNNMSQKFETVDHVGPASVAVFLGIDDKEEQMRIKRRAFETVQAFLKRMKAER